MTSWLTLVTCCGAEPGSPTSCGLPVGFLVGPVQPSVVSGSCELRIKTSENTSPSHSLSTRPSSTAQELGLSPHRTSPLRTAWRAECRPLGGLLCHCFQSLSQQCLTHANALWPALDLRSPCWDTGVSHAAVTDAEVSAASAVRQARRGRCGADSSMCQRPGPGHVRATGVGQVC